MKRGYDLGAFKKKEKLEPLPFMIGAVAGVGLWYLLKTFVKEPVSVPIGLPSQYANLDAVAVRLDELKTLYRSGRLTPEQAISATSDLITEARKFRADQEKMTGVVNSIASFQTEIREFMGTPAV